MSKLNQYFQMGYEARQREARSVPPSYLKGRRREEWLSGYWNAHAILTAKETRA